MRVQNCGKAVKNKIPPPTGFSTTMCILSTIQKYIYRMHNIFHTSGTTVICFNFPKSQVQYSMCCVDSACQTSGVISQHPCSITCMEKYMAHFAHKQALIFRVNTRGAKVFCSWLLCKRSTVPKTFFNQQIVIILGLKTVGAKIAKVWILCRHTDVLLEQV